MVENEKTQRAQLADGGVRYLELGRRKKASRIIAINRKRNEANILKKLQL